MDDLAFWTVIAAIAVVTALVVGAPLLRLWTDVSAQFSVVLGGI